MSSWEFFTYHRIFSVGKGPDGCAISLLLYLTQNLKPYME